MSQIAPGDVKPDLSLSKEDIGDDDRVKQYIAATEAFILNYVRQDLNANYPTGWPEDIKQAIKILVVVFYNDPVGISEQKLPVFVKLLLAPHRDFSK